MISLKFFLNSSIILRNNSCFGCKTKLIPCKNFSRVTHVIFDLDGTILDNHEMLDSAYKTIFKKYNLPYDYDWRFKIFGMVEKMMWKKVVKDLKMMCQWDRLYMEYQNLINKSLPYAPLKPGIERLINHFEKHHIPMAVVTNSSKTSLDLKTTNIQHLMSKFSHVLCGDDVGVTKSKPSGQIYLLCAEQFFDNPYPENCLVFENTPNGVMAASGACMQVVGVTSPPITSQRDIAFANEVVHNLSDFWPGRYGLPLFKQQLDKTPSRVY